MPCSDEDSKDIAYIRKIFTFLESQPDYYDMKRVYAKGMCQNAMFSIYIGYCFPNNVRGVYQCKLKDMNSTYRKVASSNTSRLKAHEGFFRLLMKGIFYPYVHCDLFTKG